MVTMRPALRMARRGLASLLGERTYVLMVLLQLLMVCSALFFAVGYSVIFSSLAGSPRAFPERTLAVGFYTPDHYNIVLGVLHERPELSIRQMASAQEALDAVRAGDVVGAVVVGPEFRRSYQQGGRMRVFWVTEPGNLLGAYATRSVADVLSEYGRSIGRDRAMVRNLTYDPLVVGELEDRASETLRVLYPGTRPGAGGVMQGAFEVTYTLVIPLLLLFSLMVATSIVMDSLTEEMETGTMETLLASPVPTGAVVLASTLPAIALTLLQVVAWTLILRVQGIAVHNPAPLLAYLVLVLVLFTGLGVLAASLTRRRRPAHALYSLFLLGFVYHAFVGGSYAVYSPANVITAIISNPVLPATAWGRILATGLVAVAVYGAGYAAFRRAVEG